MQEKRKCPRVDKALPIKLSDAEFDILTETKNISASGAYFPVDKSLQIMTKLNIVLLIPFKKSRTKEVKKINCCGVVVRIEDADDCEQHPYKAAIYFSDLKDRDKKTLRCYIDTLHKNS